jgi:hypothetical protein
MGQRRVASPVTATADFLARDILNRCGRAFPAIGHPISQYLGIDEGRQRPTPRGWGLPAASKPFASRHQVERANLASGV